MNGGRIPPHHPSSSSSTASRSHRPGVRAAASASAASASPSAAGVVGVVGAARLRGGEGGHDQLSPQSPDQSSDESDSASSSGSVSPPRSLSSEQSDDPGSPPFLQIHTTLIVQEMSDFDSDDGRIPVVRPHAIEDAESERSRSRSRNPPEVDRAVLHGLRHLNCISDSDGSDLEEAEYNQFRLRQREEKKRRRMTSGSIGKRNFSESIGSASDYEDVGILLDASEVGSSARRLRRKVGDRRSLQFQDPPPPRIDELDEPQSSDDDMVEVGEALAKELPYYALEYISMEVDSA